MSAVKLGTGKEEVESTIGGQTSCIVCFRGDKSHAAVPCGHLCVCEACAERIQIGDPCPVCRKEVAAKLRVYL